MSSASIETNTKISVIVPVFGVEAYLNRCVDSILAQNYSNLEIILVDDGSKDRSGTICDEYATRHPEKVKVLHKENGGLMSAWMAGVDISTGEYLAFVDSDDWIEPIMISSLAEQLCSKEEYPLQIICSNCLTDHGDGTTEEEIQGAPAGEYTGDRLQQEIKNHILGNPQRLVTTSRCMKLFSRKLIKENMHFCDQRIHMGEDLNITVPAILDCDRLVILEGHCDYHYFYNPSSIVHHYNPGLAENILRLGQKITEILVTKRGQLPGVDINAMREREFSYLFMLVLKNELRSSEKHASAKALRLCIENDTSLRLKKYPIEVEDVAGKLLLPLMRFPNPITARVLHGVFRLQAGHKQ